MLPGKNNFEDYFLKYVCFFSMFVYKNSNRSSKECKKIKNKKNHMIFINQSSRVSIKLFQTDEDVHL